MSNGARLIAVIVVVVLAAIGLYYAFLYNPDKTPALVPVPVNPNLPSGTVPAPGPVGGLDASHTGTVGGEATKPSTANPPSGAFAPPSGAAAGSGAAASGTQPVTPPASGTGSKTGGPVPVGATGSAGATHDTTAAGATTEYTIQAGDTFDGLARRFLNDATKAHLIAEANPTVNPTALKIGQKIKIPGAATVSGASTTPPATAASGANTYTVQKGDTLSAIARKVYGSDADWRRILEANAAQLKGNAEAIQPGMKLSIPAKR